MITPRPLRERKPVFSGGPEDCRDLTIFDLGCYLFSETKKVFLFLHSLIGKDRSLKIKNRINPGSPKAKIAQVPLSFPKE
jgi:hypothetical protein